jgi:hypothetical protein
MELARTKKELVEVKMERDILKKQPRTLPGSRCPVRDDERIAASLPFTAREASFERISQRVLLLAGQTIIKVGAGRSAAGGRDQSGR